MIVGIDVSKDKLDIHISGIKKDFVIKNTQSSIHSFMKNSFAKLCSPELIVFEATGGYEKTLQLYLLRQGRPYHKAHPNKVHYFGKSKGYFAKTDRIDARMLSLYGEQVDVVSDQSINEQQIEIQELSARKTQLKDQIEREQHRLNHVYLNKQIARSLKRMIKALQKEVAMIEESLESFIAKDEALEAKRTLLKTVKGIGDEISTLLVSNLPELG